MIIDTNLLQRYDQRGPRYTSYPTVPAWSTTFGAASYTEALADGAKDDAPVALYVHLPYCLKRCLYCGCHAIATSRSSTIDAYLDRLDDELALVFGAFGDGRAVQQMHWGGGTPNHLSDAQLERLMRMVESHVRFAPGAELSIEGDPRVTTFAQLLHLRALGFDRISFGVQDLDAKVQEAIGRLQPTELVEEMVAASRDAGFTGVNVDLVYGLPRQTRASFWSTIAHVRAMSPDRVACFGYAHLPSMFAHQRAIADNELPDAATRSALFGMAVEGFTGTGYQWIGLDHFALKGDSLAVAQRAGRLHRDFMGYTTRPPGHLIGVGMSAISEVGGRFAQNAAQIERWRTHLGEGELPIVRGHVLSDDDRARRSAILRLMCDLEVVRNVVDAIPGTVERLAPFEEDGLVEVSWDAVRVTPLGRYFLRNICTSFDAYLPGQQATGAFSRTV